MQRELIKWIQSLDLSFPLKNPRRDLSNGFLVAEIISRYDKDISLHSFDTGCAMARKYDNWVQIRKILERRKCKTITGDMVENTLQSRPDAARDLLEKLYTHLTHKELRTAALPASTTEQPDAAMPSYARKTALSTLRRKNDETADRLADLTGKKDTVTRLNTNNELLLEHHVQWKAFRLTEPDRFKPDHSRIFNKSAIAKAEEEAQAKAKLRQKQTVTREMDVKGVDEAVCEVFAARDEIEREEAFRAGFDVNVDLGSSLSRVCYQPLHSFGVLHEIDQLEQDEHGATVTPADADLSEGQLSSRSDQQSKMFQGDYFSKFIAHRAIIGVEAKEATWKALNDAAKNTAKLLAYRQEDVAHLTMEAAFLFTPTNVRSDADDDTTAYDRQQILSFFANVGQHLVTLSSDVAVQIAERFLLPIVSGTMSIASPGKFAGIMSLLMSFINPNLLDDVKGTINRIQLTLDGTGGSHRLYAAVYWFLASIDFHYCFGADTLCQYYATAALSHTNFQARVAGLMLVELLCDGHFELVLPLLPAISRLAGDPSWEVRVNAMEVAARLRVTAFSTLETPNQPPPNASVRETPVDSNLPPGYESRVMGGGGPADEYKDEAHQQAEEAIPVLGDTVAKAFTSFAQSTAGQKKLTLRILSPFLHIADDALLADYIDRLMAFPHSVRARLVAMPTTTAEGGVHPEVISGAVRPSYIINGLSSVWHAPSAAEALLLGKDKHTTYQVLSVFEPLVLSADLLADRELWLSVLSALKSELLTAIFDPGEARGVTDSDELSYCAEMATAATTKYYADLSGEPIDEGGSFQEIQQLAIEWLQSTV